MILPKNILQNKKAVVPSTLVWIIGTILILIIMLIYLVFSALLFVGKGKPSTGMGSSEDFNKATVTDMTLAFLESPYSEKESMMEFISKIDSNNINQEELKLFKVRITEFLQNLIGSKNVLAMGAFYVTYLPSEGESYKTISDYTVTLSEKIAFKDNREFGFVEVPILPDKKIIIRVFSRV